MELVARAVVVVLWLFSNDTRSSSKTNQSERQISYLFAAEWKRGLAKEERGGAPPRRIKPSCLRASIREATLHVLLIFTSQSCRAQMEGCWEINNGGMIVAALTEEEEEEDKPAEIHAKACPGCCSLTGY